MPYTVGCDPAPLTITIRPRLDWQLLLAIAWVGFAGYKVYTVDWPKGGFNFVVEISFLGVISLGLFLSFIRRERIEIYPDRFVWDKTFFGITQSITAPLDDVLGAEWIEGERGYWRRSKQPNYVEFHLPGGSVRTCSGFTYEEFDRMREDIRSMYPDLVKRWGTSTVRSKDLTLLNLS